MRRDVVERFVTHDLPKAVTEELDRGAPWYRRAHGSGARRLERLGEEINGLTLRKAQAYALLHQQGLPLSSLGERAQQP